MIEQIKFTSHYVSINSLSHFIDNLMIKKFTSHYVSINSTSPLFVYIPLIIFTSHYVSINSPAVALVGGNCNKFTSHYVSINSDAEIRWHHHIVNLHPTMYLLIPVIIKASLFLNSEALFCLPFKSANRLLILYALNMLEA